MPTRGYISVTPLEKPAQSKNLLKFYFNSNGAEVSIISKVIYNLFLW